MPKILLVEDNVENRDVLARRLMRHGFDVVLASNGHEAVTMAQAEKPDLILMDMNMPELDGWEATKRIKAEPESTAVPIIAVTAHDLEGDRERALAAGCVLYQIKPVDVPALLSQIESLLQKQPEP